MLRDVETGEFWVWAIKSPMSCGIWISTLELCLDPHGFVQFKDQHISIVKEGRCMTMQVPHSFLPQLRPEDGAVKVAIGATTANFFPLKHELENPTI
jgi:hypothetical protein